MCPNVYRNTHFDSYKPKVGRHVIQKKHMKEANVMGHTKQDKVEFRRLHGNFSSS